MCDVVGRLLSSCISHLVGRRTTNAEEDVSCDPEYNTEATRYDEQPLPLSMEMDRRDRECNTEDARHDEQSLSLSMEVSKATPTNDFWMRTAIEPGRPKKSGSQITWQKRDKIISRMQAERMSKDEEIPSMWNYDPRCLAKEFVGLDQKSFLVDPSTFNICFLDKDILRKISKMLSPLDFLNLSYTCRFLHWRLFTFCTCYAPYTVVVGIWDTNLRNFVKSKSNPNKAFYIRRLNENDRQLISNLSYLEGQRLIVADIPSCLRKPFFFDELTIRLYSPFFDRDDFDQFMPFILAVYKNARQLHIEINYEESFSFDHAEKFFEYPAVNDFLRSVNASSYFCIGSGADHYGITLKVFENCPHTRVMDIAYNLCFDNHSKWENLVLLNRIGHYINPPVSTIIRTIEEFKYGAANLDYHEYEFEGRAFDEYRGPFLEYFFANYDEIEEYHRDFRYPSSQWITVQFVTITTKKTGRRHRIKVSTCHSNGSSWGLCIAIGKESLFTKNLKKARTDNQDLEDCKASSTWYRMETAVEPEEEDREKTAAGDDASL